MIERGCLSGISAAPWRTNTVFKYCVSMKLKRVSKAVRFTDEDKDHILTAMTGRHQPDVENGKPILKVENKNRVTQIVRLGDWIIEDVGVGFYYPMPHAEFIKKYQIYT